MKAIATLPMRDHLRFIRDVDNPPITMCKRGDRHENQVVHDALLRRGLIEVDAQGYTHLTDAGRRALVKETGILFAAPMILALLDNRKRQTRRLQGLERINAAPGATNLLSCVDGVATFGHAIPDDPVPVVVRCPYGGAGDRLWVRETWQAWNQTSHEYDEWEPIDREERNGLTWAEYLIENREPDAIEFRATSQSSGPWTPAIHMPRWASRITLEITGVRVERLQSISEDDAKAEGVTLERQDGTVNGEPAVLYPFSFRQAFIWLWDAINKDRAPWASSPWVWALDFKRLEQSPRGCLQSSEEPPGRSAHPNAGTIPAERSGSGDSLKGAVLP